MPRTIAEGFADFLVSQITPLKTETDATKSHRASIKACLKSKLNVDFFFRTGSIGNGTSVSGYSDVDYFAVIPRDNLTGNSNSTLKNIKKILQTRFPFTLGIRIDSPAVVVPFGTKKSETTEIVPADFMKRVDNYNIYDIPNCYEGWMKSSPTKHKDYVTEVNKKLSYKVKL